MTDWFTVETIDKDTFAISEYRHWEETHCYLICGTEKAVLIDTGLGIGNIKSVVDSLTSLPVMAVTTHVETVCLLSNRKPDTKVRIDVDLEDYYRIKDAKKNQN